MLGVKDIVSINSTPVFSVKVSLRHFNFKSKVRRACFVEDCCTTAVF